MRNYWISIFLVCISNMSFANSNPIININSPSMLFDPTILNSDIYVTGNGSIANSVFGGNSLNIGKDYLGNIISANFSTMDTIRAVGAIRVYAGSDFVANYAMSGITSEFTVAANANVSVNAAITGAGGIFNNNGTVTLFSNSSVNITGLFTNSNGGVLNFENGSTNNTNITNNGLININGSISNLGSITNNKEINVYGVIAGSGNINNSSSGIINLMSGYNVSNTMHNNGILNLHSGVASVINNAGTMNVESEYLGNGAINNTGVLNLFKNINLAGHNISNAGVVAISGNVSIVVNNYFNQGVTRFTINDDGTLNRLNVAGTVDLANGGTVDISTRFVGKCMTRYVWEPLSATTINYDDSTIINIPTSTLFSSWESIVTDKSVQIIYNLGLFCQRAKTEKNMQIAGVLEQLSPDTHQDLLYAISSCTCEESYNKSLDSLAPYVPANTQRVSIQNAVFNKVELRVNNIRSTSLHIPFGMAYGEINSNTAIWGSWFGSLANQNSHMNTVGYHATSSGGLAGIDFVTNKDVVYGIALGISNSNVHQNVNGAIYNRVLGYHAIAYGSMDIFTESNFIEWLITGITNKNKTNRSFMISGQNYNAAANYNTAQGGIRINVGQCTENDFWKFTLMETLRYSILYQPQYNEQNSIAALHVTQKKYYNILTIGGGLRLSLPDSDKWTTGAKEVRIMGTYDAVSSNQVTAANFVNSAPAFTVSNSSSRWGVEVGASYTYTICDRFQLQLNYDFELRTKYTNNSAEFKVRFLF